MLSSALFVSDWNSVYSRSVCWPVTATVFDDGRGNIWSVHPVYSVDFIASQSELSTDLVPMFELRTGLVPVFELRPA